MLDGQTHTSLHSAGALSGQRIIVLGACCGFGRGVVRDLVAAGARVVVADANTAALSQFAGAVPMPVKGAPVEALRRIGRVWGAARLDAVLNLMPLRHPDEIDLNIAFLTALVQGFMPALAPREGQIISVVGRPDQPLDVARAALAPALATAQAAYVHALHRDGLSLNMINVSSGAGGPARTAVKGLLGKSLGRITATELRF